MNVTVNGALREFPDGMNALDIACELDRELKKTALAARVNGTVQDLAKPVPDGSQLEILTADDPDGLRVLRHTASHVLAQAVKTLKPEAKLAIGPAIDNGFYYDFDVDEPFTPEFLAAVEKEMARIIKKNSRLGSLPRKHVHHGDRRHRFRHQAHELPRRHAGLQAPHVVVSRSAAALRRAGIHQLVLDAERIVELLEEARRLHIAEAPPLLMERQRPADVLVVLHSVDGHERNVQQCFGRNFLAHVPKLLNFLFIERRRPAEDVRRVELVFVLKRRHRAAGPRELVGQIGGQPAIHRRSVDCLPGNGSFHPFRRIHAFPSIDV